MASSSSANSNALVTQLAFYGAYHANPSNQVVHAIFVPMIFFSAVLFLAEFGLPKYSWVMNLSTPALIVYATYYIKVGGDVGIMAAIFYTWLWYMANVLVRMEREGKLSRRFCLKLAAWSHIVSWVVQVAVGHGIFEGRKPALLDSLVQSFGLAPLFVVYETVFALGFKQALKEQINAEIAKTHMAWAAAATASVAM